MPAAKKDKGSGDTLKKNYTTVKYGGTTYRVYADGTVKKQGRGRSGKWNAVKDEIIIDGVMKGGGQRWLDKYKSDEAAAKAEKDRIAAEDKAIADATSAIPTADSEGNVTTADARGLPPGYQEEFRVTVGSPEDQALQEHPAYAGNRKVIGNTVVYTADPAVAWQSHNESGDVKLATDPEYIKNAYQSGGLSCLLYTSDAADE